MCWGREGEGKGVCVGVIVCVRKGVCGWDSRKCCHKVCVSVGGGKGEVGVCVYVYVCVWM